MSDEDDVTPEEKAELERIANVYAAAAVLCKFLLEKMDEEVIGIACDDEQVAREFFDKLRNLYKHLSGDVDADRKFLITEDSATGSTDADSRQEGGDIRPSHRKLH